LIDLQKKVNCIKDWLAQNRSITKSITVNVEAKHELCCMCDSLMKVQKTIRRAIVTLQHGRFYTHERVLFCSSGCKYPNGTLVTRRAESINDLVPIGANYGYDLEVFIGMERFIRHRQREEIRNTLESEYGISISNGEISKLTKRFLYHVEALHTGHAIEIKNALLKNGGYSLHIDATTEDGKGTLLVVYAGWLGWVLGAWKIPSERADAIAPRITEICEKFGEPCAIVRDLGQPMSSAVEEAADKMMSRPRVLACHFHFLRDIGKDLLSDDHDYLRKLIRNLSVRENIRVVVRELRKKVENDYIHFLYEEFDTWIDMDKVPYLPCGEFGISIVWALGQWILDYSHDGKNLGFPFDRPYLDFYRRCRTVSKSIKIFLDQMRFDRNVDRALERLAKVVSPMLDNITARKTIRELEARADLFDSFRAVFRLEGQIPDEASPDYISYVNNFETNMKKQADDFIQHLKTRYGTSDVGGDEKLSIKIILDHLERHGKYLWGHLVKLSEESGGGMRLVDRTNNVLENFFHKMKHHERRRSGRKILTQDFENIPPAATLVMNYTRLDYIQMICGTLDNLPLCFSRIDKEQREKLHNSINSDFNKFFGTDNPAGQLSASDKTFIRKDTVCDWISAASEGKSISSLRKKKSTTSVTVDKKFSQSLQQHRM